ncbi:MAG: AI-2E family transporter [Candidatus Eremiobacteraeota bacterium]|nr:AI-2E family transporter [Candidatus Eremiobacteraeota bacterium]MCW5871289.1 AI-2E family transporter [Candidatus Eremiobacteraeota bacterium]
MIFWLLLCLVLAGWLLLVLLKAVHLVAIITCVSTLLAYVISPAVSYLHHRRKMPRIAAISLVYVLCALAALIALAYVIPAIQVQFIAFMSNLTSYAGNMQHTVDSWLLYAQTNAPGFLQEPLSKIEPESVQLERLARELQNNPPDWLGSTFAGVFAGAKAAFTGMATTLLVPLFTFYILMDANRYRDGFLRLFPRRWKGDVDELLTQIDHVLGNYIRGQLLVCLTIGVSIALLLTIMGVPYAILIGVFAGVVDIIPYVGVALGMIPAFLIALGHKGLLFAVFVIVMMEVVHWTEGHIIVPAIIGQSVGLPPLVVMIALGAGAELGGVMGMFLSMPLAAIVRVLVNFYISRLEQWEQKVEDTPTPVRQEKLPEEESATPAVEVAVAAQ